MLIIDGRIGSASYNKYRIKYYDSSNNILGGASAYGTVVHHWGQSGSHGFSGFNSNQHRINQANNTNAADPFHAHIHFYGWGTTTPHLSGQVVYTDNNGPLLRGTHIVGKYEDGSTVPYKINISPDSGNITAGDVYLYKLV